MKIVNNVLEAGPADNVKFIPTDNQSSPVAPIYLIVHFTAGTSVDGAVSWFQNPAAKASAHLVIGRGGEIVQMVPFNKKAWHAGESHWGALSGLNAYSIGIELVNAGKLVKTPAGKWITWSGHAVPDDEVAIATHKNETHESGWHRYTEPQIESLMTVGKLLYANFHFDDVLGHDDIAPNRKVDPGPLFPMIAFRSAVLGRT